MARDLCSGRRTIAAGALAAGLLSLLPLASVAAQAGNPDPRWQAWLGCWQPAPAASVPAVGGPAPGLGEVVCVTSAAGTSAVDVVTVADGKIVARERVEATGQRRESEKEGCAGWERAEWSPDAERVYLRSEYRCAGGVQRTSSGLLAMSPAGEWLDVQSVTAGANSGVRVTRYREAPAGVTLPAELTAAVQGRTLAVSTARAAAAAPIATSDVVEAVRHVDAPVVEAWLAERGQGFAVDGKGLVALADAGVPGRVIDMMVALSYPKTFAVNPSSREGELRPTVDSGPVARDYATDGRRGPVVFVDPYGFSSYGYSPFGWNAYSPYGGYPYGYPYGYGSAYGWYPGGGPVIVIRDPNGGSPALARRGRAVKGRGYTRGDDGSDDGPQAEPRSSTRERPSAGADRGSGASGGGASSRPIRTAKPRP
jgi:hypothetical protein